MVKQVNIKRVMLNKERSVFLFLILLSSAFRCYANPPIKLDSLTTQQVWFTSQVLPGSGQIINKQYWKVHFFYAGMGTMAYMGYKANQNYHRIMDEFNTPFYGPEEEYRFKEIWTSYKIERNIYFATATGFYIASIADALIVHTKGDHSPLTATVFSALIPGMGQVYNQKIWKVPVIFAGVASLYYVIDFNQRNYKRFGDAYKEFPNDEFGGSRNTNELLYLRDGYRRNRDLSIISLAGFYILNIIDANVDAHFFDWDISDDLAFKIEPMFNQGFSASLPQFQQPYTGLTFKYNF